jgi:hypothetical protein
MGIAEDIKAAYIEVGTEYEVLKSTGEQYSGEYLMSESNSQVTKPFVREFFLEAALPFDTSAASGDVVTFVLTGTHYLLVTKTPEMVENALIEHSIVLYKANVSGELLRFSGEIRDDQFRIVPVWNNIRTSAFGCMTEALYGGGLDEKEEFIDQELHRLELYVPKPYGIRVNDRYSPVSGEFYKVVQVKTRSFEGIDIAMLEEDVRED